MLFLENFLLVSYKVILSTPSLLLKFILNIHLYLQNTELADPYSIFQMTVFGSDDLIVVDNQNFKTSST